MMMGGGHERKIRSGTVNVPCIAGFGLAVCTKIANMKKDNNRKIKDLIIKEL